MAPAPDPHMWELHIWRTLATELFVQLSEEKNLCAFAVDLDPGFPRRPVILTTTPRTASLEVEEQAPPAADDAGRTDRCVECGSTRVSYENYLDQLFCWPCADGQDWPRHPRKGRAPESEVHVHPGGIDADLLNPVKDAKR